MTTLKRLRADITNVVKDTAFESSLVARINNAVLRIAGGVRMPDKTTSPPLPRLYATGTVATDLVLPYASLPATYQRSVIVVYDSTGQQLYPPEGGDYYSFKLFMRRAVKKDLSLAGDPVACCVKGKNLYYQGTPALSADLTVDFYRLPVSMTLATDSPDGLPEHLETDLIKHFVCKEIFGEGIEDGEDNQGKGTAYHTGKFFELMQDLVDFVGIDTAPKYYGGEDGYDLRTEW